MIEQLSELATTEKNPAGYYAYLHFKDGELVAFILSDDFTSYTDVTNTFVGSNLWDVIGFMPEDWEDFIVNYLTGSDYTINDKPFHDDGMEDWFKVVFTNDVMATMEWMDDTAFAGWRADLVEGVSYEDVQQKAVDAVVDAAKNEGNPGHPLQEAVDLLPYLTRIGLISE